VPWDKGAPVPWDKGAPVPVPGGASRGSVAGLHHASLDDQERRRRRAPAVWQGHLNAKAVCMSGRAVGRTRCGKGTCGEAH
jgi:hypothetical protein